MGGDDIKLDERKWDEMSRHVMGGVGVAFVW